MSTKNILAWLTSGALLFAFLPFGRAQASTTVAEPFRAYYAQYQGMRLLGYPITGLIEANGYQAQYFEKGRLEDHPAELNNSWSFMYGRLTAELIEQAERTSISGTTLTYADLGRHHQANLHPAPNGFAGGVAATSAGTFVPYDAQLRPAYGYVVPANFWEYITQVRFFPGGWLHDIGLPMTDAFQIDAYKNGKLRKITVQAFERTVLTYDSQNPTDWQVESANIGTDMVRMLPSPDLIEIPAPNARVTLPLHRYHAPAGRSQPHAGTTLIVVTHNHEVACQAQRVITLRDGKIQHDVALATEFERSLLDFKSSALGQAVLHDEGMPAELQAIAPQLRLLLERV